MGEKELDVLAEATDFSDIPDDEKPDISTFSLEDFVNDVIIICAYKYKDSEFGKGQYIVMDVLVDGEMVEVSTGANAVVKQITAVEKRFPIRATVKQKGRKYYLE